MIKLFHTNMEAKVRIGGSESSSFPVEMGVKQGDVLAPVLFNLFISIIMTLLLNTLRAEDGIQLEYRLDGSLFNIRRLKAHTKTTTRQLVDLQYADDAALMAHTAESMQRILDTVSSLYHALGLQINIRKTEVIVQQANPNQDIPTFTIDNVQIQTVPLFRYLGSIVTPTANIDEEVLDRINKASRAFGKLRAKVFQNKHLRLATKIQVYTAVCISTLLYSAEAWTIYRRHLKQLEKFHINSLQKILGLTWKDRVPHTELLDRAGCTSIEAIISKRQLRWLGHVIRMPEDRLPRQILYGQLLGGHRRPGGPKRRYKDQAKTSLKKCNIAPDNLELLASDRTTWAAKVSKGVEALEQDRTAQRNLKRQQRHARRAAPVDPDPQLTCPYCNKTCRARIGLVGYLRACRPREQANP